MTDGVERFFAFARERHAIHLRRRHAVMEPWTSDPILWQYRFTNVFRELDRTTVWFRENVRDPMRDSPDVLLATVVFRWFNRIATGEAIFSPDYYADNSSAFEKLLTTSDAGVLQPPILDALDKGPYVTGAYIVKTPDGYNKLDGVLQCIRWFMEQEHPSPNSNPPSLWSRYIWRRMADSLLEGRGTYTLEEVWNWLRQFPYLGDFMAYEIVTDLRWTALLDQAPDIMTWANPGPGATRGVGRVFMQNKDAYNQHRDKESLITDMRSLLAFSRDPAYWPQWYLNAGYDSHNYIQFEKQGDWPAWEMRDVEHTLCEFDKYERVRTGEGRPRGRFR